MKLNLQYGNGVIALPAAVFPDNMPPDAAYLYVLLAVCKNPALLADTDTLFPQVAAQCRLPEKLVKNAVAYWLDAGIFSACAEAAAEAVSAPEETAFPTEAAADSDAESNADAECNSCVECNSPAEIQKPPRSVLPQYPAEELARIIRETEGLRPTLDECARIAGKIFSEHECAQLAALYDAYGMDGAYLMTVFMYCRTMGKTSVSYVVKTALGLYDDGIRTVEELEAHIAARERSRDNEYKIRKLFGLGERALTAKEKEYIETWLTTWNMPLDVITRAYEITIANIEKPRMSYINKILSGWYENGIRTIEAVDAAEAAYREKHAQISAQVQGSAQAQVQTGENRSADKNEKDAGQNASYDINEFLELAMKRSFDQM